MFDTENHPSEAGETPGSAGTTRTRAVVLVEDDADNRESIAEALQAEGFQVHALAARPRVVEVLHKPFALQRLLDAVRRHA